MNSDTTEAGLEKAVDALQQLHGEYASLEQMQHDAMFVAEPLIAAELRRRASDIAPGFMDGTVEGEKVKRALRRASSHLRDRAEELDGDDDR